MNIEKFEINKPSELTQVVFTQKIQKDVTIYKMSSIQIDLVNSIFYKIREYITKKITEIDRSVPSTVFEFTIKELNSMLPTYNNNEYRQIIEQLDNLSDVKIVINSLGKNKELDEMIITRFIHEIRLSKHKETKKKIIKLAISNEIISRFVDVKKYFSKMFLTIQFSMKSKYSKLLYELLKDYEGIKTKSFKLDVLMDLINVSEESQRVWSTFRPNILQKAINEINEKSDISISYLAIKEKLQNERLQVTKIKFTITPQSKEKLEKLGLIEESITTHKLYKKSKLKLDTLVKTGYNVIDEDMWIKTDIKENEEKYEAELKIDKWLKEIDQVSKNELFEILAESLDECDDRMVYIDNYKIVGLFTKEVFTKNAKETREIILKYQNQG